MLKKGDIDAFIEAALTQASMTKSEEDKGGRIGSREEGAKLKYVGGKESSEDDREDVIEKIGANQDNDEMREGTEGDATEDERDEEQELEEEEGKSWRRSVGEDKRRKKRW